MMSLFPPPEIKALLRRTTIFPFMKLSFWLFPVSCCLMALSFGSLFWPSLNYGIDFRGGLLIEAKLPSNQTMKQMRSFLDEAGYLKEGHLQELASGRELMLYQPLISGQDSQKIASVILQKLKNSMKNLEINRVEIVGPTVSSELIRSGIIAVGLVLFLLLLYLCFRFEWHFGVGAIFAVIHDVLITLGIFVLLQWKVGLSIVAALLAVAGYSLNDTVVVYDRIRENLRKFRKKPMKEMIDISVNETLSRSVLTSATTFMALLILYIWGGSTLRGFTFAMLCGIVVGTYSSVFVASFILPILGMRGEIQVSPNQEES